MIEENTFTELPIHEKVEFIGKLIIAAQHGYFGECSEIVNRAQSDGLFEKVKPVSASLPEIKNDLDNPIN